MSLNMILSLLLGISMTIIIALQVSPNLMEQIKTKKVQTQAINNQEVIFEAIKRYITIKQDAPTGDFIDDLISEKYIDEKVKDNGFGGTYTIKVDKALGVATITTTIADPKAQETFLNSYTNVAKPTKVGTTNNFETKFLIPHKIINGNTLVKKEIPIQATPPLPSKTKYWYDTNGTKVVLKIFNGTSWVELKIGS